MSVPIFFSSLEGPRSVVGLGYQITRVLGMVFGAIHCAGWNLVFPSIIEGYMWRISSVFIVVYPAVLVLYFFHVFLCARFPKKLSQCHLFEMVVVAFLFKVLFLVYIVARLFILLEAFLALCNPPILATYAIQWTTFIPHI